MMSTIKTFHMKIGLQTFVISARCCGYDFRTHYEAPLISEILEVNDWSGNNKDEMIKEIDFEDAQEALCDHLNKERAA